MLQISIAGVVMTSMLAGTHDRVVLPPVVLPELRPSIEQDVGAHLSNLMAANRERGQNGLRGAARALGVELGVDDKFEVDLIPVSKKGFSVEKLMKLGLEVVRHRKHSTTVNVSIDQIAKLPEIVDGLASIEVPCPAVPMSGEGVQVSGATIAQTKGARGQGVKVGVIDIGFKALTDLVDSEDLPPPFATKNFTKTGLEDTSDHGTQVAEVIYQMAPDAQLVLAKIQNLSQFVDAMAWMTSQGVKIVNVSIGFPGSNFGDGTGQAAAAVDKAFDNGAIPIVAAGDYGDKHWIGPWYDANNDDSTLDFMTEKPDLDLSIFAASNGDLARVYLTWNAFPKTDIDMRLEVYFVGTNDEPLAASPETLIAVSDVKQKGNQAPVEVVAFAVPVTGNYAARVIHKLGAKPTSIQLHTSHPIIDWTLRPQSSIVTPGDAEKGITVGALGVGDWTLGPARPYSGRGPTTSNKSKPNIVGPDGVAGTLATPFLGTSCSAPHVAGACAAILSIQPQLTATDVRTRLLAYAQPMGDPLIFGSGRLDLTDDFFPPTPNPPTFDKVETKTTAGAARLVVAPMNDDSGPVQYKFDYAGKETPPLPGANGSDWQNGNEFIDEGLQPNRQYRYKVTARDSAIPQNYTTTSLETKLRTQAAIPPAPDIIDVTSDSVKIGLTLGENPTDVEMALFFVNEGKWLATDGSLKKTPVWALQTAWKNVLVSDLDPISPYEFKAIARNKSGVETSFSTSSFAVTLP